MTQKALEQLCALWQRRLRLQDWDVTISFAAAADLGDDRLADVEYCFPKKSAQIRLLAPKEHAVVIRERRLGQESIACSVVHELLHLHLGFLDWDDAATEYHVEHAINALARALTEIA